MADKTFELVVVTPERTIYRGEVHSLVLPGANGLVGILADHAPFVTAIDTGPVKIEEVPGKPFFLLVSNGFFEVAGNKARLLAEVGERADEIDVERARAAEKRARERLLESRRPDIDLVRAEAALRRAVARQKLVRDLDKYRVR
jgi:F-type H+-transporting ATPase subunit epsilon